MHACTTLRGMNVPMQLDLPYGSLYALVMQFCIKKLNLSGIPWLKNKSKYGSQRELILKN